ncbi:Protein CBG19898 [Caenorhabditis briggsae]|uniref:Protein CBG19898 n=1 Tax=Caenorhabditis briggsae TaxID=6238 RepID=A8XWP4_CAEBR|nr:Protein CBG19898 [Caenorhabditis briggsae]CAP37063.2 Protein CBG19898 [Caenorhabditis briggsae]
MSAEKAVIFLSNRSPTENENYFKKLSIALELFTHTWSLSVEVQFCLLVPFIFLIGRLFKTPFREIYFVAIVPISSYGYHFSSPTSVAFNSVFARFWQFSIGMMTYFIVDSRKDNKVFYEPLETMDNETEQILEKDELVRKSEVSGKILWVKNIILVVSVMIMLVPIELNPLGTK